MTLKVRHYDPSKSLELIQRHSVYIARGLQYYVYLREGILLHNAKCKRSEVWAI